MTAISTNNKVNRIRDRSPLSRAILYFVAALVAFITIYPMYYVLVLSLSAPREALTMRVYWWPKGFFVDSYTRILSDNQLWTSYRNTIIYCSSRAVLTLLTSVMAAYPLTVPHLFGRKFVTMFLLIPMYVTGGIIPEFILMTKLGLYNTPWALILPGSYSIWYIILVRSYFRTVPEALRESAKIDGASEFRIYFNVVLPLCVPVLVTLAIFSFQGCWNDYVWPLIVTNSAETRTLTAGLATFSGSYSHQYGKQMAGAVLSALPILLIFLLGQKYFIKGISIGGIKG